MNKAFLLALDQGTTSTRAILFDGRGRPMASHAVPLKQHYPANGWVEHDAEDIWRAARIVLQKAAAKVKPEQIAAIGIANQRETTVIWDRVTGKPLARAIVWQDRRTAARCDALRKKWGRVVTAKTGLLLDPYFSATKLEWLLKNVKGARKKTENGTLAFGTIDSWLVWKLTGVHATDVTNAARTMLFNIKTMAWDDDLLRLFKIPRAILPRVKQSMDDFGRTALLGRAIPIRAVAGDQQAAAVGQACFSTGDAKATFGTGCFILANAGGKIPSSRHRLLATALCRTSRTQTYALEGSVFIAGAVVQWLRDQAGFIASAADSERLARAAKPAPGLYFVPAFTGLGAPHWRADSRGALVGLTRDAGKAEITRAALDAVCYQTRDLLEAMKGDMQAPLRRLKIDGGMVGNDWFCQRLADITGLTVERPRVTETTALGACYLAGLAVGIFKDAGTIAAHWALDCRFRPRMAAKSRNELYQGWQAAVARL